MKIFILSLLSVAVTLLIACDQNTESAKVQTVPLLPTTGDKAEGAATGTVFDSDSTGTPQQQTDPQKKQANRSTLLPASVEWDKKIIKTAVINAEVKDYNSYYLSLREKVKNLGGYVAQENQSESTFKIENTVAIKIPVDQFDNAVQQLSANLVKINERQVTSQDVSTEMVDTKSRMEAKRQVRERYLGLLRQAKNMDEILQMEREINGVQEQIESAAGRINFLGHSTAFSTIHLTYYQVLNGAVQEEKETTPSFGDKIAAALLSGWKWISDIILGLLSVWPLLLGGIIGIVFYRRWKVKLRPVVTITETGSRE